MSLRWDFDAKNLEIAQSHSVHTMIILIWEKKIHTKLVTICVRENRLKNRIKLIETLKQ